MRICRQCFASRTARQILLEFLDRWDYDWTNNPMNRHDHVTTAEDLRWPRNITMAAPPPRTVHVWCVLLHGVPAGPRQAEEWLSDAERERAARFRSGDLRGRHVASRLALRGILGHCLGVRPNHVAFETLPRGKPRLADSSQLEFNRAHSGDLMLLAVTRDMPVGIDVERIRPINDALGIARRFFTRREAQWLEQRDPGDADQAFFRLWTRKEAILKASGEGISNTLATLELLNTDGTFRQSVEGSSAMPERVWNLREVDPARRFMGAMALPDLAHQVEVRTAAWPPA